jgi:hypothetical protein
MKTKEPKRTIPSESKMVSAGKPAPRKTRPAANYLTPVKKESVAVKPDSAQRQARIQQKAFDFYQRRGCLNGFDQFDWTIAEAVVDLEDKMGKASKLKSANKQNSKNLESEIERKAYEIFERRGYTHGYNEFDWQIAKELVYIENNMPMNRG